MDQSSRSRFSALHAVAILGMLSVIGAATIPEVLAGCFRRGRSGSVGGISINTNGIVAQPIAADRERFLQFLTQNADKVAGEMMRPVGLRMISLKRLEAAIATGMRDGHGQLEDSIRYLAGLQRIQYVLVYPEENDIVLAGPGEGWRIDEDANVVGMTTGRPVLQLDDLLVALRTVDEARTDGISCSIDPTEQGRRQFQQYMDQQKVFRPSVLKGIENALGPQQITLTGVPETSHFARVLVAADYRMKRLAMNLERAPVEDLPGFLDLMKSGRVKLDNMMPRWWLACNYDALAKSDDGLAWQIRGQGVKAMTEDDFITAGGQVQETGRVNPIAQEWANQMTAKYDELSTKAPVFGELRNIMDMCVVAAVISREGLLDRAGCQLPLLVGTASELEVEKWPAPKTVSTQCSTMKRGREYIITASGGVEIESWQVAENSVVAPEPGRVRGEAAARGTSWWWNG